MSEQDRGALQVALQTKKGSRKNKQARQQPSAETVDPLPATQPLTLLPGYISRPGSSAMPTGLARTQPEVCSSAVRQYAVSSTQQYTEDLEDARPGGFLREQRGQAAVQLGMPPAVLAAMTAPSLGAISPARIRAARGEQASVPAGATGVQPAALAAECNFWTELAADLEHSGLGLTAPGQQSPAGTEATEVGAAATEGTWQSRCQAQAKLTEAGAAPLQESQAPGKRTGIEAAPCAAAIEAEPEQPVPKRRRRMKMPAELTLGRRTEAQPSNPEAASTSDQPAPQPAGTASKQLNRLRRHPGKAPLRRGSSRARFRGTGSAGVAKALVGGDLTSKEAAALDALPLPPCLQRLETIFIAVNTLYGFLQRSHIQVGVCGFRMQQTSRHKCVKIIC